ncbi:MAG: hypothetical protein WBZ36_22415 [Candidatus Nitrosopolaris sp.]
MSNNSEFLAIAKSSDLWRYISAVIMTVTSEGQFEACPKGIEFRSKSCEAFIDIAIPSAVFQQFYCPTLLKFGLRLPEFSKIIKRVDHNFPIEVCIQDRSIVITTIGAFFSCYKSNLIESSPSVSPVKEIAFDVTLVIRTETLAAILDDIEVFSEDVTLKTTHEPDLVTIFSGISDRGSAAIAATKNNGIANIRQHTSMRERCEGTYSLRLISDLLDSIGAASEYVQLEYSSGGTLRLKFLLLGYVTIHLYVAAHT